MQLITRAHLAFSTAHCSLRCAAAAQAAVAEVQNRSSLHAPEVESSPAPVQKRGAVIGAKPQLSASGLLAAAQLAKEKETARLQEVC